MHRAHAVAGQADLVGLCGGQVQAMTALDGAVYLGTPYGIVYRWSPGGGLGYAYDFAGDVRGMAAHGGSVILGTADGRLTWVDPADGGVLSSMETSFSLESLLLEGDVLLLGTTQGFVMAYDLSDQSTAFFGLCTDAVVSLASDGATSFAGEPSGNVLRFGLEHKHFLGTLSTPAPALSLALFGGDLLVGGGDGVVRRLDRLDGTLKGSFDNSSPHFSIVSPIDALVALPEAEPDSAFCHGVLCPCGNDDAENGCRTSTGFGSALIGTGSASAAADDLVLYAYDLPAASFARHYMSPAQSALPFGDGLLCASGGGYPSFRFDVALTGPGALNMGPGVVAHAHEHFGPAGAIAPGQTWKFQVWFRDPAGPCGSGFNTSPGYAIAFAP